MKYLSPLIKKLESSGDPKRALASRKYLKDQFECFGVYSGIRREILQEFLDKYGLPPIHQMEEISLYLWDLPEREFQYSAIDLLDKVKKQLRKNDIDWLEKLVVQKSWWDTVDGLAGWIIGAYFRLYPETIQPVTEKWMDSNNMWLQRTSLLFQLKYKRNTDTQLLSAYILRLADRREFFIRKAIGWVLREYSKTNKEWVKKFIQMNKLSPLSFREASKYIELS